MVHEVRSEEEFHHSVNDRRFNATIVKFHAQWCDPCKGIKPLFHQLSRQHPNLKFVSVDIDSFRMLTAMNGVNAMPTFLVFKNGMKTNDIITGAKHDALVKVAHKYAVNSNQYNHPPNNNYDNRNQNVYPPQVPYYVFDQPNSKNFMKKCVIL